MLKIRLSRGGRKKLPFYRILATNATSPRDSKFLEKLGTYNPLLAKDDAKRVTINKERAEYWLSVGAKPTEKVAKFLAELGVQGAEKHQPNFKPKEKGEGLKKKALARVAKEKEAKLQVEAEAKAKLEAEAQAKLAKPEEVKTEVQEDNI